MANIATRLTQEPENSLYELLGMEEDIKAIEWKGLPDYVQKDKDAKNTVIIRFRSDEDLNKFADLIEQPQLKVKTKSPVKSTWFPPLDKGEGGSNIMFAWLDEDDIKDADGTL